MSQSKTHFYHEAINGCFSIKDYENKVKDCGDSTTGFSLLLDRMKDKKIVIIKKNNDELEGCISWCDAEYNLDSRDYILEMNSILNGIDGLVINQSDINKNLKNIWHHLVDDEWNEKHKNLINMNIQTQSTEIDKIAASKLYASIQ